MSARNETFGNDVVRAWPAVDAGQLPSFEDTWRAAERRHAAGRRQKRLLATAAALVAAVAVGVNLQAPPVNDVTYIEVAEILGSTSWSAPSDVLLPEHEFDIYQELPTLIESTQPAGGSLL